MIRVLLVDDHEMVRAGVSAFLSTQPDIEVVAEASDGQAGAELALKHRPDVVLMDLVMEPVDGVEGTRLIRKEWPEAKILVVTSFLDDEKVYPVIEAGAMSYVLKTASAFEIAEAIRKTADGQSVMAAQVTGKMMERLRKPTSHLHDDLTEREQEVLQLMARGMANQEIADELFISLKTVKTHVSNILSKLDVVDRTQAVVYAFKHNIVK
ncbi:MULTISPECIES: response regulator transcription factor [Exiguobacterium]|uniref:Two component transcriptional regulator, LuxR family n=1 Tax=Exiguobacterium sibiricum (strain DSM 17290 / CCUG 55495 / CIP 109462 / JCM 13490 / 255-15) TaxID=262543 RepID=B1YJQ0_EXIS2|nr:MULTISPECIES: response regulator transcription factor [Exiguobacterium]ACB60080.1 two component transcriptional regulator, LuxR family [Exiguobacterium sibiricum 255-15]MCT4791528.1 response regulator transcription factor [Exiguobacterium artemiae]MDW2885669.1 response regulator transcription factor [Exiguobacterium sibiricum]MDX1260473.1 response regulator transcription factor [Exiguobacterium sp. K1]HCN58640.1 DNA-binding response regulator [Exiguobacterium sp.]